MILEPNPRIKKRFQQDVIEELRQKESGSSADIIEMHAKQYADTLITTAELGYFQCVKIPISGMRIQSGRRKRR